MNISSSLGAKYSGRNDIRGERQLKNLMKGLMIWKTDLSVQMMLHRN